MKENHQSTESSTLTKSDAKTFFDALDQPVQFNRKLLDALAEHETRVISR